LEKGAQCDSFEIPQPSSKSSNHQEIVSDLMLMPDLNVMPQDDGFDSNHQAIVDFLLSGKLIKQNHHFVS